MIYVDTCLVTYAIEDDGMLGRRARALFLDPAVPFAISPLVMMEALVAPLRSDDDRLIDTYHQLFTGWDLIELDVTTYLHAAQIRAANPTLKTVDALHLAAAQLAGCTTLWTNDKRLTTAAGSFAVDVIGA